MSHPSVSRNKYLIMLPLLILLCVLICGCSNSNSLKSTDPDSIGTESSNTTSIDLTNTCDYLFYDETSTGAIIKVQVDSQYNDIEVQNIECYQGNNLVSSNTSMTTNLITNSSIQFTLQEYVAAFDRIRIITSDEEYFINAGQYYFEKLDIAQFSKEGTLELVQYNTKDLINSFEGTYTIEGDCENYDYEFVTSEKLSSMDILVESIDITNNTVHYSCSINSAASDTNMDINFDVLLCQINKVDSENRSILLQFSIQLEPSSDSIITNSSMSTPPVTVVQKPSLTPTSTAQPIQPIVEAALTLSPTIIPTQPPVITSTPSPSPRLELPAQPVWVDDSHQSVYFGSYPQTEISGSELTSAVINADYDNNGTASINDMRIKRISFSDSMIANFVDSETLEPEYYNWSLKGYHYFIYEPILWQMLSDENGQLLLLSKLCLDEQPFNPEPLDCEATAIWNSSLLRSWMNGYDASYNSLRIDYSDQGTSFINAAFSKDEQSLILTSDIRNEDNPESEVNQDAPNPLPEYDINNNTSDRIFLLSRNEVKDTSYGFPLEDYGTDFNNVDARIAYLTDYTWAMGAWQNADVDSAYYQTAWWWLRTPGYTDQTIMYVSESGGLQSESYQYSFSVRPSLRISTESVVENDNIVTTGD